MVIFRDFPNLDVGGVAEVQTSNSRASCRFLVISRTGIGSLFQTQFW